MIEFNYTTDFRLRNESILSEWIAEVIQELGFELGDIMYHFCDDETLYKLNVEFLNHDTYTDIISFDYTMGKQIHGEIYISVDRVKENAHTYAQTFENELNRVMIHGILHYCGFKDETELEQKNMRAKEDWSLSRLTVD